MKNVTDRYKNMISSFCEEAVLELNGTPLPFKKSAEEFSGDVELLCELEYKIKHDQIRILEM